MALSAAIVDDFGATPITKKITCSGITATSTATGFYLPAKAIVTRVYIDVTTKESTGSTKTFDIGIDTDDDKLAAALSVATAAQVNSGVTMPVLALGGEQIYVNSNGNALTEAVVDVFIEYLEL